VAPAYAAGFVLGIGLITPIGMQNLFVLNQGLRVGFPRVLVAIVAAGISDTTLIVIGATGASAVLAVAPTARAVLLAIGFAFLVVLGIGYLVRTPPGAMKRPPPRRSAVFLQTVAVSFLNPHAVLDTVGVIGGAIAAQPGHSRLAFALGSVSASWTWFLLLGGAASMFTRLVNFRTRLWIQRGSGVVMLAFSGLLLWKLIALD
jgi:L-lysine exporter family protein LysE/ArgO